MLQQLRGGGGEVAFHLLIAAAAFHVVLLPAMLELRVADAFPGFKLQVPGRQVLEVHGQQGGCRLVRRDQLLVKALGGAGLLTQRPSLGDPEQPDGTV